jgi:hypothetical protein
MVLGEVAILIVAGLALGLAVAVFSTRLLASFLYRLEPDDPTTLVTASAVLAVSAVVCRPSAGPARRKSGSNDGSPRGIRRSFGYRWDGHAARLRTACENVHLLDQ